MGDHVMLFDLKQPLKEGDLVKIQLTFEKAGMFEVEGSSSQPARWARTACRASLMNNTAKLRLTHRAKANGDAKNRPRAWPSLITREGCKIEDCSLS